MNILLITFFSSITVFWLCVRAESKYWNNTLGFFSLVGAGVALAIAIGSLIMLPFYYGASVRTELLNRELNTNYTTKEVFFASDIIEEIRYIQRQRIDATIKLENPQ